MDQIFPEGVRMTVDEDATIVRAVQNGRRESFAELVERHKDLVYGTLMRLTGDPQTAEELAHETFVRAYKGIRSFRGESRFGTWLVQIAIHLTRDRLRERRRDRTVSLDELLERDADAPFLTEVRPHYDPLAEVSERDLIRRFEESLRELPSSYREVFVLHHIKGLSYEDIGRITGDSVGSLKVRSHRARKLLKEMLFTESGRKAPEDVVD
jgi:RNA polymerase sigma-70 factor (ECF subfamily)